MAISKDIKNKIKELKIKYDSLRQGKESLLDIIFETEIPEAVYNSNAIENSTLTIRETEKILMEMEISRNVSVREVFEAKNLAKVSEYIKKNAQTEEISKNCILFLHKMLISNINDKIAGRFRRKDEYVRVASHIAPAPEHIELLIDSMILDYTSDSISYFLDKIAKFHLEFEHVHPFLDGNGRIGRVIINYQLARNGFPPIIIRDKEKKFYYSSFSEYKDDKKTSKMEKVFYLALIESLHKRIAYLDGEKIISLSEYSKKYKLSLKVLLNKAKRQTISAFHEKGVWKIGE